MNRRLVIIIIFSFLGFILPIVFYASVFNGGISNNQENWSQFGSYLSGLSGSMFSFLSFITVIINLNIQIQETKKAKDETAEIKKEALNEKEKIDLIQVLSIISKAIDEKSSEYSRNIQSVGKANVSNYPVFTELIFLLSYMKESISRISDIDNDNSIVEFYKNRYSKYCIEMNQKGILEFNSL